MFGKVNNSIRKNMRPWNAKDTKIYYGSGRKSATPLIIPVILCNSSYKTLRGSKKGISTFLLTEAFSVNKNINRLIDGITRLIVGITRLLNGWESPEIGMLTGSPLLSAIKC